MVQEEWEAFVDGHESVTGDAEQGSDSKPQQVADFRHELPQNEFEPNITSQSSMQTMRPLGGITCWKARPAKCRASSNTRQLNAFAP